MVGDPKNLSDLAKIEAAVRAECACCNWQEVRDVAELSAQIMRGGGSTDWQAAARGLHCGNPKCQESTIRLLPLPFTKAPVVPARRFDAGLIRLALLILDPYANEHRSGRPTGTLDVRLALRALVPYIGRSHALTTYWEEASASPRFVHQTCHHPFGAICHQLRAIGWDLDYKGVRWRGLPG